MHFTLKVLQPVRTDSRSHTYGNNMIYMFKNKHYKNIYILMEATESI